MGSFRCIFPFLNVFYVVPIKYPRAYDDVRFEGTQLNALTNVGHFAVDQNQAHHHQKEGIAICTYLCMEVLPKMGVICYQSILENLVNAEDI